MRLIGVKTRTKA